MSFLSPRLQLRVVQKQILTPGLVQMVTVLQLNRLELKEMITQEIVKNPVLEEVTEEPGEEITPEELLPLLEQEQERITDPADKELLESLVMSESSPLDGSPADVAINGAVFADLEETAVAPPIPSTRSISVRPSTIISIPATRAPLRNRLRSLPSRPSSPPPLPWATTCTRS